MIALQQSSQSDKNYKSFMILTTIKNKEVERQNAILITAAARAFEGPTRAPSTNLEIIILMPDKK